MSVPPAPIAGPVHVLAEAEARTLLRAHPTVDGLEPWLADQPWQAATDGSWRVAREREGWTYRVEGGPCGWLRARPSPAPSPRGWSHRKHRATGKSHERAAR